MPNLSLAELSPEARKKALEAAGRRRAPRRSTFSKNRARTFAIRVLAIVAELTPDERARVLRVAADMNRV